MAGNPNRWTRPDFMGHPGMKPRERIAFCAYGRDRTHFVEPCREHPGPADSDTKVANVTTIKEN
jgi:hypothetical protein